MAPVAALGSSSRTRVRSCDRASGQGRSRARRLGMHSRAPASNATAHTKAMRASALILPFEPPIMQKMPRARATAAPKSQSRNTSVREVGTATTLFLYTTPTTPSALRRRWGPWPCRSVPFSTTLGDRATSGDQRVSAVAPRAGSRTLWLVAINLLEEGLGIEGAGRSRNAGDDREGDQGGYDGLHGSSPCARSGRRHCRR